MIIINCKKKIKHFQANVWDTIVSIQYYRAYTMQL